MGQRAGYGIVMAAPVLCNASPLIALAQLDELELLRLIFGSIIVPPAVRDEVAPTLPILPVWVEVRRLQNPLDVSIGAAELGRGESETLALALETGARLVLLDDRDARRLAERLNLPMAGTAKILFTAKQRGYLPSLKPALDALIALDFRLSPGIYELILRDAGEL